jgi:hypothetical protein
VLRDCIPPEAFPPVPCRLLAPAFAPAVPDPRSPVEERVVVDPRTLALVPSPPRSRTVVRLDPPTPIDTPARRWRSTVVVPPST